ncbi:MAG TPA: PDGLE domain-containing protein [Syntrophorhabdaceae bacterium]|nr:PDGLE domain-containing protein [Syntrophorhabdaceae bacterium]
MTRTQKRLWIGIIVLTLVSPLGIILPEKFRAGQAWGEWNSDTIRGKLGYTPQGLKKESGMWKAPMADYGLGGEDSKDGVRIISYALSGFVGIAMASIVLSFIVKMLRKT